jgi:hypothetical protein
MSRDPVLGWTENHMRTGGRVASARKVKAWTRQTVPRVRNALDG